jgi:hypothetical protein
MTGLIFVLALLLQSIRDMGRDYGRVRFDVLSAHGGKPERVVTVIQVRLLMAPSSFLPATCCCSRWQEA